MAALEASVSAAKEARKRHPTGRPADDKPADGEADEAAKPERARRRRPRKPRRGSARARRERGGSPESKRHHRRRSTAAQLKLSNLDKVLYPEAGFTKGEVIDYYARIAPVLLTHLGDRGITMRRFPNGVDAGSFFEKRCPTHRPDWVQVAPGPGDRGGAIDYCRLADEAAASCGRPTSPRSSCTRRWRACDDIETPTMVVFDLDPGAPADINDCAEVGAVASATCSTASASQCFAKTSGSKGLQVYVPLNTPPRRTSRRRRSRSRSRR